jgi:hypothetical protein
MRVLGYVFSLLGLIIVILGNIDLFSQLLSALVTLLRGLAQTALLYSAPLALTVGGLVLLVIGLVLILMSYRRYGRVRVRETITSDRL